MTSEILTLGVSSVKTCGEGEFGKHLPHRNFSNLVRYSYALMALRTDVQMPPELVTFENDGVKITSTSYWKSDASLQGWIFLTWNAGGARLLVPPRMNNAVQEMKTALYVIVSQGPTADRQADGLELLFEDKSGNPYVLNIQSEMYDRALSDDLANRRFPFLVYTPVGLVFETEGRYRRVSSLPCRRSWAKS